MDVGTVRLVPRARCLPRRDPTHVTPAWVSDMTGKDAPTPYGARTLASIVLIFNHPSLSHPEATVRTSFAGQSRNLWNVGGHGLGIFGLDRLFRFVCSIGVG